MALACCSFFLVTAGAGNSAGGYVEDFRSGSDRAKGEYTDCVPTSTPLVFDGGYRVGMCYETADGKVGEAKAGIWASGQSGLLWFFDRGNAEALVKVLDGCAHNGRRWIYVAPVTDLAFNLHVTSSGGRRWTHRNRLGETASTRSDTSTFACAEDDAAGASPRPSPGRAGRPEIATGRAVAGRSLSRGEYTDCRPTTAPLVFHGHRVSMCYETADGKAGEAKAGIWASNQSGLLWFFDRGNAEVLVKVLDGRSRNGNYWIFVAPVTDLAFNLHVTSADGREWTHRNRLGQTAVTAADTSPFANRPPVCQPRMTVSPGKSCAYPGTTDAFSVDARGRGSFLGRRADIRCHVGMTVRPGQSCMYPGTTEELRVNANGGGSFLGREAHRVLRITNETVDGRAYDLHASHQGRGAWRIFRIAGSTAGPAGTTGSEEPGLGITKTVNGRKYDFRASHQGERAWRIDRIAGRTEPPRPPFVSNPTDSLTLAPGGPAVDIAGWFSDPDGDPLTFTANSSNPSVVTAVASSNTNVVTAVNVIGSGPHIRLTPVAQGSAVVTVTATDQRGASASTTFNVTVNAGG